MLGRGGHWGMDLNELPPMWNCLGELLVCLQELLDLVLEIIDVVLLGDPALKLVLSVDLLFEFLNSEICHRELILILI